MKRRQRWTRICLSMLIVVYYQIGCHTPSNDHPKTAARAKHVATSTSEPPRIYLTVRLQPNVRAGTLRYLAENTQTSDRTIPSGTTVKSLLKQEYGVSSKSLKTVVRESNPTTATKEGLVITATHATLPPGPLISQSPEIKPRGSPTLQQLVQASIGTSGPNTRKLVETQHPELAGQWDNVVKKKIVLPYATHYSSYLLKTQSLEAAQQVADQLKRMDSAVIFATASYELIVAPSWTVAGAAGSNECSDTSGNKDWPFGSLPQSWSDLDQIGKIRPALVAVLDTGLADGFQDQFPLWENPEPGNDATLDEFSGLCVDDVYGCNFVQPAVGPVDDCSVPAEYHHGTHIAGLVSGLRFANHAELDKRLEVMILKVADSKAKISPADMLEATRYAFSHGANVVNLSLTGQRQDDIGDELRNEKGTLFVAAAGNPPSGSGINLDDAIKDHTTGYPARLSRVLPNLISVASHDGRPDLDCFSNFGPASVDIAAPGFSVASFVSPSDVRSFSGTSQATALVSLTAAILFSQGVTNPSAIKHRIIASVDYKTTLSSKVFSSGVLNVSKATRFKDDILQFADRHIETGEILQPLVVSVNEERNDLALRGEVYKVLPHFVLPEGGEEIRVMYLRTGQLVYGVSPHIESIRFKTSTGIKDINVDQLIDIIPKLPGAQVKHAVSSSN